MGVIVEEGDCTLEGQRSYIHLKEEDKGIFSPKHAYDQQFRLKELSEICCGGGGLRILLSIFRIQLALSKISHCCSSSLLFYALSPSPLPPHLHYILIFFSY